MLSNHLFVLLDDRFNKLYLRMFHSIIMHELHGVNGELCVRITFNHMHMYRFMIIGIHRYPRAY